MNSGYQKLIDLAKSSEEADRALGSVFGAFIGDAVGAVLQKGRYTLTKD